MSITNQIHEDTYVDGWFVCEQKLIGACKKGVCSMYIMICKWRES